MLRHVWGFHLEEVITAWDDGRGYSFAVVKPPFPIASVHETWTVDQRSRETRATTVVEYDVRLGALGRLVDVLLIRRLIRREMRRGLAGLKRHIEAAPPHRSVRPA